ncbi:MAG: purine phosphorylase [Acidiferrobacterales bacterium]
MALAPEARCLLHRRVKPGARVAINGRDWVQLSGIGPRRAARAAQSLLSAGATALLSWGTAGALAPQLQPGSLVLPQTVMTPGGDLFPVHAHWHAFMAGRLKGQLTSNHEPLLESPAVVAEPAEKAQLFQRWGAVAVDMESAAVAAVAAQAEVPYLVIRAVSDSAASGIPADVINAIDANGRWRVPALTSALLKRPQLLVDCVRLRRDFRVACRTLRCVAAVAGPDLGARQLTT